MATHLAAALDDLASQGLNWVSFVPAAAGPIPHGCSSESGDGLLLVLSLGATFGEQTLFDDPDVENPFDVRATQLVRAFLSRHFEQCSPATLLYPGEVALDLRAWLAAGRVEYPSFLGTGIRPDCGPWFAVRAAAWVRCDESQRALLEARYPALTGSSPCESCDGKPCLVACPVDALRAGSAHLNVCIEQRTRPGSTCAEQCHARSACPVGSRHRYAEAQMRYHYRNSLLAIQRWRARGE